MPRQGPWEASSISAGCRSQALGPVIPDMVMFKTGTHNFSETQAGFPANQVASRSSRTAYDTAMTFSVTAEADAAAAVTGDRC